MRVQLGGDPDPDLEAQEMMILTGMVNRRSGNFPSVYQHDTVLPIECCGGPLVDLDGRVIGINIARAGRTESYAIPADLVVPLIEPMIAGKMPPPSDSALR
jgi:serine protease Do